MGATASFRANMRTDKGIMKKVKLKNFDYRWKAESLFRSSPYLWMTSHKNWRPNNYFFKLLR